MLLLCSRDREHWMWRSMLLPSQIRRWPATASRRYHRRLFLYHLHHCDVMTAASVPPVSRLKFSRDVLVCSEVCQRYTVLPCRRNTDNFRRSRTRHSNDPAVSRHLPLRLGSLQTTAVGQRLRHPGSETHRSGGGHAVLPDSGLRRLQSEHPAVHPRSGSAVHRLQSLPADHWDWRSVYPAQHDACRVSAHPALSLSRGALNNKWTFIQRTIISKKCLVRCQWALAHFCVRLATLCGRPPINLH